MKVLSTDGLTELIQLTKDNFISNSQTAQATVGTLATVATTGAYSDLTGTPTIPTVNNATLTIQKNGTDVQTFTANASSNVTANITVPTATSDLTNDSGYITGISSSDVTTALGYTPYSSNNPAGYTSNVGTVTSVNNTSPDANGNVTITIPTVNDATLTIQKNGTDVQTFSANASSNVTANITVPTQASDIGAQPTLVSGTNIKTINNTSLLGSGDISVITDISGKADVDLTNVNNSGTSLGASWAMPSNTYDTLTLGASGANYQAPANGYIALASTFNTSGYLYMYRGAYRYGYTLYYGANTWVDCFFPILKGQYVTIQYSGTASVQSFRFYYAQGSESEAS